MTNTTTKKWRSAAAAIAAAAVVGTLLIAVDPGGAAGAGVGTSELPLATIGDAEYVGAFALPAATFGESSLNYSEGPIEVHDGSLFVVGHAHQQAIAEFTVPPLVDTVEIAQLNTAADPIQEFATVLDRASGGNNQRIDRISGLDMFDGQLVVNAYEYYDAPADNTDTTIVIRDPDDLAGSEVVGYHRIAGAARAAGWMTELPAIWQAAFGATHLTGHSSNIPIHSRSSIGPSLFALDAADLLGATGPVAIETQDLLSFALGNRLADDLSNASGTNDLWTHLSGAEFGFVIPGTRTYMTVGSSGGHDSGVGYKITQSDGNLCGGYCSNDAADKVNAYWMWDLEDLLAVKAGEQQPHEVRPYEYGEFEQPFQTDSYLNPIGGGSFDASTGTLYLSIARANNTVGTYSNPPIIVAYQFPSVGDPRTITVTGCEAHTDSIVRLYAAAFGRTPERAGFRFWYDAYRTGDWTLPAMARFFTSSDEFSGTYGRLDNNAFVRQLYRNVLGREGEASGVDFWTGRMAAGDGRGTILLRFAESPENIEHTATLQPILGPFSDGVAGGFDCSRF